MLKRRYGDPSRQSQYVTVYAKWRTEMHLTKRMRFGITSRKDKYHGIEYKYHGIEMSIATLKRRIKEYGLKRRNGNYDVNTARVKIRSVLDGPGCMGGYRHV